MINEFLTEDTNGFSFSVLTDRYGMGALQLSCDFKKCCKKYKKGKRCKNCPAKKH